MGDILVVPGPAGCRVFGGLTGDKLGWQCLSVGLTSVHVYPHI